MAYRKKSARKGRSTYRRQKGRSDYRRRSARGSARRSPRNSGQTLRIVLEQPGANPAAVSPEQMLQTKPRKARF